MTLREPTTDSFRRGLPVAQFPRVLLDLRENTTEARGLLRRHAAMAVEIERFVSHRCARVDALRVRQIDRADRDHSIARARLPPAP